jgi:RNA polymerase-binding transcription factor DksA
MAIKKKTVKKTVAKKAVKKAAKKAPAKKKILAKKPAKKVAAKKKVVAKKPAKKVAAKKKVVAKKAAKKVATKKKVVAKKAAKKVATKKKVVAKKPAKQSPTKKKLGAKKTPVNKADDKPANALKTTEVSRTGAAADKKSTPIVFSLDDVEELMASKKSKEPKATKKIAKKKAVKVVAKKTVVDDKPIEKRVLGAASLADILGFNPAEKKKRTELGESEVPKKWKKYYKLLIELREHVSDEISLHTADTLKHSSREDSGDLSGYGNHQADAGTDTFDRDFALSLVSNEQDALNEIEEAILRIKDGSYGVCEVTGKAIPAARLTAVPFARYSVQGQIEHEKNQHRKKNLAVVGGIFGDVTDAPKIQTSDDDE